MAFFGKLRERLFKSSAKLEEGLEALVEEAPAPAVEPAPAPKPEPAPAPTPDPEPDVRPPAAPVPPHSFLLVLRHIVAPCARFRFDFLRCLFLVLSPLDTHYPQAVLHFLSLHPPSFLLSLPPLSPPLRFRSQLTPPP